MAKIYSFHLKIQMETLLISERSCQKLVASPSCLEEVKSINFNIEKLYQQQMHVEILKSTFKYHAVPGQQMRNNCTKTSPNTLCENHHKEVHCDC